MRTASSLLAFAVVCACVAQLRAQDNRIFRTTPETVAIWEFNDLAGDVGVALPNGAVIPDLSGNGRDALVKGNNSGAMVKGENLDRELFCGDDDLDFAIRRANGNGGAHAATNGDGSAFEFAADQDFSVELFVVRDETPGTQNWGILAGTWHSRTLLDDGGNTDNDGAWYGYGLIRHNEGGGWIFNMSPINPDRTFDPSFNEQKTAPNFEIPAGEHYVAISVDREAGVCTVYLDGEEVSSGGVPPGLAFYTPTNYDPSQFAFLTGVDDVSRGAHRTAPVGYAISAARVQTRTISAEEAEENTFLLEDCIPVPFGEDQINAVIAASTVEALVDQCVTLSGANSTSGADEDITTYEWKIGDGAFEAGDAIREVSFDAPAAAVEVTLKVTDSGGDTAERILEIAVSHPVPIASIAASKDGSALGGNPIYLRDGDMLSLDSVGSVTPIPATAVYCPAIDAVPLDVPAITEYRWDLDSDGTVDETTETVDLTVAGPSEFTVTLTVVNEAGAEGSATIDVVAVEIPDGIAPGPPGRIFLETDDTVGIWEFNDFEGEVGDALLTDAATAEEINNYDGTVEGNDLDEVVIGQGDPNFGDTNTMIHRVIEGDGRVAVNDDEDMFEMSEEQDFSMELYVHREEVTGGEQWGALAGTWHSRNLLDDAFDPIADGAWYGFGFVLEGGGDNWIFDMSPISPDGTFNPSFNEVKTPAVHIPPGYHYLVATVKRGFFGAAAKIYLDGEYRGEIGIPAGQAFITPPDHDHARMVFLVGEDDSTLGMYRGCPSGYSIDAARVTRRELSADEIEENHLLIRAGFAVPPGTVVDPVEICDNEIDDDNDGDTDCDDSDCSEDLKACPPGAGFVRGDSNSSGIIDLTDGVVTLGFLFTGGPPPACLDAADTDDNGSLVISDAVITFSYLFTGGAAPVLPSPSATSYAPGDCGPDPTDDDALDCGAIAAPCQ
jgi:PKD repeat protein